MALNQPYTTSSSILTSFDWVDVETGTGIIQYKGAGITESAGVVYTLDKNSTLFSYPNMSRYSTTTSYVKAFDLDFDCGELTIPQILKGTAIMEVPITQTFENSAVAVSCYIVFTLKKVLADGTTEETIVTKTSSVVARGSTTVPIQYYIVSQMEVPRTDMAIGQKLRLTMEVYAKHLGDGGGLGVCYEPSNAAIAATNSSGTYAQKLTGTAGFTQMRISIPYQIPD